MNLKYITNMIKQYHNTREEVGYPKISADMGNNHKHYLIIILDTGIPLL